MQVGYLHSINGGDGGEAYMYIPLERVSCMSGIWSSDDDDMAFLMQKVRGEQKNPSPGRAS
jgi:hypothetical protein